MFYEWLICYSKSTTASVHIKFQVLGCSLLTVGSRLVELILLQGRKENDDYFLFCLHRSRVLSYILAVDVLVKRSSWKITYRRDTESLIDLSRFSSGRAIL